MSERREKFVKLAETRVNKTLKQLQLVGNLSNNSAYEYSDEDTRKIFLALQKGLDEAKSRFKAKSSESNSVFKL